LVEGITGLGFWSAARIFTDPGMIVSSYFWLSFLVLLAVSDIKWLILPHPFNDLYIVAGFVFSGLAGWKVVTGSGVLPAVEGFLGAGALMALLAYLFPKGLGGGDVKMTAAIGAWLGLTQAIFVVFLAATIGSLLLVPLLIMGKVNRRTFLPFGSFLAVSAGAVWFFPAEAQLLLNRIA
jgi:leader peptidase (prepilin peptidase)/N-methyltransferase